MDVVVGFAVLLACAMLPLVICAEWRGVASASGPRGEWLLPQQTRNVCRLRQPQRPIHRRDKEVREQADTDRSCGSYANASRMPGPSFTGSGSTAGFINMALAMRM